MRNFILFLVTLWWACPIFAQETVSETDTTIYVVAEQAPLFPLCNQLDTTYAAKTKCTQEFLLAFVYKNVQYPMEARQAGIEGTVVASFVVEPDSTVSNVKILKDIGGNCGAAVTYVISAMNEVGLRWVPGKVNGKDARTQMTLPIKFKLEEPLPYVMSGLDTIYKQLDTPLGYKGGSEAFTQHLKTTTTYPASAEESCAIGYIDVQLLVQPDGIVKILELLDYNNLGLDFQLEATNVALATSGQWEIATYKGRKVPTTSDMRIDFLPPNATACKQTIADFEQANALAIEAVTLYGAEDIEGSIQKYTAALQLFPNHAEFLASRGQGYIELKEFKKACNDLSQAAQILGVSWYDNLLMVICRAEESEE